MAVLQPLLKALQQHQLLPRQGLSDPPVHHSLRCFASLLSTLVQQSSSRDAGAIAPQHWTKPQLEFVLATAEAVIVECCDLPAEDGVTELVEKIAQFTVQLCVEGIEKSSIRMQTTGTFCASDDQVYRRWLSLMELAVGGGSAKERGLVCVNALEDSVPDFSPVENVALQDIVHGHGAKCPLEGPSCNQAGAEISDDIMVLLANGQSLADDEGAGGSYKLKAAKRGIDILSITQHFAVVHLSCHSRLLDVCKEMLSKTEVVPAVTKEGVTSLQTRISLAARILKLLASLSKSCMHLPFRKEIGKSVVELVAWLPGFLNYTHPSDMDNEEAENQECYLPLLVSSLLQVAEEVFPDDCILQNLRTFLATSILDTLDVKHDGSLASQESFLFFKPQIVSYFLGLIRDMHAYKYSGRHVHPSWTKTVLVDNDLPVYQLRSQPFHLNEVRRQEDCLQIIFPFDGNWLDKLVGVIGFFYGKGINLRQGIEKLHQKEDIPCSMADHVVAGGEDDALFGNLFSESGRHSPNSEGGSQTSLSEKALSGSHNLPFQAVVDMLSFLKDCIFSCDWQRPTFESACKQLNKGHIDVLLQINLSCSNLAERVEKPVLPDSPASLDVLVHVQKFSFYLLHSLIVKQTLSDKLEEHLFFQILERGYTGCTLSHNGLILLAKILVNRSIQRSDDQHDTLKIEFWRSCIDNIVSKAESLSCIDMSIQKACAGLPSVFHIEVLLMAFHSLRVSGRTWILQKLISAIICICNERNDSNGSQLTVRSLLVSRLVMTVRYMLLHFRAFPSWLLEHMRRSLRYCTGEDIVTLGVEESSLLSWTAITAHSLKEGGLVGEHQTLDDQFLLQLFDVSGFVSSSVIDESLDLNDAQLEASVLCNSICLLLERWRGMSLKHIEELIVERYFFFLGWGLIRDIGTKIKPPFPWDLHCQGSSLYGVEFFVRVSQSLYNSLREEGSKDLHHWVGFILETLCSYETVLANRKVVDLTTWDLLRVGPVLSLLLSLLQEGLASKLMQEGGSVLEDRTVHHFALYEQLGCNFMEDGRLDLLLRTLSSVLRTYIESHRQCVLNTFSDHMCKATLSSISLLLQAGVSKSKQEELFAKLGVSFPLLQSLLRLGTPTSWSAEILSRIAAAGLIVGTIDKVFITSLLHGYPSCAYPASAAVVSCTLVVEGILETTILLLKFQSLIFGDEQGWKQSKICLDLFEKVTIVNLDSSFEIVHPKCKELRDLLISSKEEQVRYSDLCLLKQQESILLSLSSSKDVTGLLREELIICVVDVVNTILTDASRVDTLKHHYFSSSGHLLLLVDVLDGCFQETVNLKVLQLLVDLIEHAGLRGELQDKFLSIGLSSLSFWLEQRFLGCKTHCMEGASTVSTSPTSVRELAGKFLSALVSPVSTSTKKDIRNHVLQAMLLNLEEAFSSFDVTSFRAYFGFLVQLANREVLLRHVLRSVFELLGKLPIQGTSLEGLKSLISFLSSVLSACGVQRVQTQNKVLDGRHWPSNTAARPGMAGRAKHAVVKNSELLQAAVEQSGNTTIADCDATSVDEDEDDGTSDGEIMSLDKEEDDDGNNSEKALASRVCTFTSSGSNFMVQHWYFCYTCDLTVAKGCCSICARVCHRGHKVVYSRLSRFFCDCGAGGVRGVTCLCLKPRKYVSPSSTVSSTGASVSESLLPLTDDQDHVPPSDSDSDVEEDACLDVERPHKILIAEGEDKLLFTLLSDMDVEGQVLSLAERLLSSLNLDKMVCKDEDICLGEDRTLIVENDLLQLKRVYKSGSFDMKIKADYSNARELKSQLASGSLVKSLLSVSSRGRLAVGEGDKVTIFDVGQLIGQPGATPVTVDKSTVKPLSNKNPVRFEVVQLVFNSANESYLAVSGYEDCQVFTVNPRGEVTDRLAIELALQDAYIRRIAWVPGSQVQLMVVTNKFVKIYDLSQDNISPVHYFTMFEDSIADATLVSRGEGQLMLVVLSQQGLLHTARLSPKTDSGARVLMDTIQLPERYKPGKGVSIHFSPSYRLLFLSYADGLCLIGRLNPEATVLTDISSIFDVDQDGKAKAAGLHHWKEAFGSSGLFVCLSNLRSNSAVAVRIGPTKQQCQHLRLAGGSGTPRVDGFATYRPMTRERNNLLILHDDGSLQVFSFSPSGCDLGNSGDGVKQSPNVEAEQVKKWGAALLGNRANSAIAPVFPLDFFEKTTCITADIRLGGDILRNSDSEAAKLSLASEDGFLEGPGPTGFKIVVFNSNPDTVMVGCRVHVGNSTTSHIPSELRIFQRAVKLEEGVRCWYDIPFTNAEALLADEEFTLTIGPTFNGSSLPRIDCLEVYGRSKDDFGWKEKLDAVLDMEARNSASGSSGGVVKYKSFQNASLQEQIVADSFRLLYGYYTSLRTQAISDVDEQRLEVSRRKCQRLLEFVFESNRQPLLQAAARRVLRALYPMKDTYYQAKDTMRLAGIARICKVLEVKVRAGGCTTLWAIQEFTAQMRAVCKISLHRRSNLASFLEGYGPSVIEELMKVLWEILLIEQPDAQTINNLVIPAVDLIYGYAECLVLHANNRVASGISVAPAIDLFKKLLFAPSEAVQASCSLAMSSRLLQVPFPKQTILAIDDVADSSQVTSLPPESGGTSGTSGQGMMEEDGSTASVQYCCDGCSTVPIVGRRWHCNVCPDFDLCEACYEVMDADRLPPPHSRDHPMSAIPIEAESMGGESGDVHFSSMDELSDESLLQVASEISLQSTSACLSSTLDANECRNYSRNPASESKATTISASKRAVNSLLLSRLLEDIRGWMRYTSGTQAVSLMQLFYRLASAPSGPFADAASTESLDLESFIKLMMEEINLSVPLSVKSRSSFGEVVILVFTFFNLMLRNWHQPGSDHAQTKSGVDVVSHGTPSSSGTGSPSSSDCRERDAASQLDRACAALRQQQLINYLFSIIQQLAHVFKSSSRSQELNSASASSPACGALLTVRKEFAAGSFTPFFTDSYAKAHRRDLFEDFHRLLLECVFRLTYSLVRPEKTEKLGEKERIEHVSCKGLTTSDLKLDGWQEVLCNFINNPHTTSIRRYARRLLLHLCGTKGHYYNVRDAWQLGKEVKRLYKLVQKSGGFQGLVSYERSVKLVKCLLAIVEVAMARPRNWQKYCSRHVDIMQFLLKGVFYFGEESVIQTLKLLTLAFYSGKELGTASTKADQADPSVTANSIPTSTRTSSQTFEGRKKRKSVGDDASDNVAEKAFLDMEAGVEQLAVEEGNILRRFIDVFLLEWNATSVRSEAKAVLYGAWHHGRDAVRVVILTSLLQKVPILPSYGQNITEYTDLLTWILGKGVSEQGTRETELVQSCLTVDVVKGVFETLRLQNELLANHPNSRIYNTLSSLVEFDGYYLESEPCLACSCPEVPFARIKLDSLKSETKFTDNRILVKCIGSHTVQSVTMNVHEPRRSKSVKVLNLYYNNRPVADLSELKNNWSLWKRARSCHLTFNQTELKVEFPIPIIACNLMIELDSFYENLQASSLESLLCPRCSRNVTDKHGICSNCHENAYQCRQCRNINYENLDSFLCNECGFSKYGRFEFNFMAKPSFNFDAMENDEDMKKGLSAIEAESENAHRRYQQLLGFKKPLLKLVSSIGETEMDSQQKDSVQQMIVSLPGSSSFKINRKIAILGVLYGEKCKMAFDSVSRSVQTLQGLRRVLTNYLEQKRCLGNVPSTGRLVSPRPSNRCYGCANTFVGQCLEWLQVVAKMPRCRQLLVAAGILSELFENNIHQGTKSARIQARTVLSAFTEGDATAVAQLNNLIKQKATYCLEHHRSMDIAACVREELQLLSETCTLIDEFWEARLRVVFQLLFSSIQVGARHPAIAEHIILPCLRIIAQACTPPKSEASSGEPAIPVPGVRPEARPEESPKNSTIVQRNYSSTILKVQPPSSEKDMERDSRGQDVPLVNYAEWKNGATYMDFVRRQYTVAQSTKPVVQKPRRDSRRADYLALKYMLRWKRRVCKISVTNELAAFEESSWVCELVLSACSQAIRLEMCGLIGVLCSQSPARRSKFLNLLMTLLPATRSAGESAAEYFELLYKMIEPEDARLYLTVRGFLRTLCGLISEEVVRIEAQERSFHIDISQGYILHKFIELLGKFLQVPNIRVRFMKEGLLAQALEAFLVIKGLVVHKTKLISDCGQLLKELLDSLLQENYENKRHFIRACIAGFQTHAKTKKDRTFVFILEQLCNIICPTKPEPVYQMVLNKAHTQEEFIRGSMTKNPYSSSDVGPLMRDVKNKICHQLDLLGLLEDDYGMELLVAGNIISLDLSIAQVYEQVWKKAQSQASGSVATAGLSVPGSTSGRECPPMTITYRLQGLDGEATEPMIKELEDDREESQDPEVEFAIAGVMRESGGLDIVLNMVQTLADEEIKSNHEELVLILKLLMYCCKIRENRQALLRLGALGVLLEKARRAFSTDATEPAEGLLLIVESLVTEANESDIGASELSIGVAKGVEGAGDQAAHAVLMFLERLSHPSGSKKSGKQQRNNDMVARILPYLTYGEQAAMEVLVEHFHPYLHDWGAFDKLTKKHRENVKDGCFAQQAAEHHLALENFVKVTESIKTNPQGDKLKGLIMEKGITTVAVRYLKEIFSVFERGGDYKATVEWTCGLELPSVPIILSIVRGLSRGHLATQMCLDHEGILPLLHALEGVSGENEIGARAENLLDTLADKDDKGEGFLIEKILNLRHATRNEMRRRALRKREELLQGLGMRQEFTSDGGERIVVSKSPIEGLEEVEEEQAGLACMVCREGYSLRPTDMLGTYCYSKRVNLGLGTTSNARAEWVYTTVSHFNVIHFQCHQEAKKADASLKNPKKEWEGATLRNNETLCNNLFPLRGPSVPLVQYARCVDQYWDNLNALGRADGSRLRLLTYDIVLMLARFATGASFSADSKGGGKESNSRLLPFMLQMAQHLLDQGGASQRRMQAKALSSYLVSPSSPESPVSGSKSSPSTAQRLGAVDETVQFMMVQSLLLESLDDWQQHRRTFLQRGIYNAYMQYKHGGTALSTSPLPSPAPSPRTSMDVTHTSGDVVEEEKVDTNANEIDKEQLFNVVHATLVYTGLVNQLQQYLKHGGVRVRDANVEKLDQTQCGGESSREEGGTGHGGLEAFEVTMKERLKDVRAMLGSSKELLEWLDDMQGAADLQEAFDIMGALGDVLSCRFSSCEEFVWDAINVAIQR